MEQILFQTIFFKLYSLEFSYIKKAADSAKHKIAIKQFYGRRKK